MEKKRALIDERLGFIISLKPPSLLKDAIEYSLFPGGKRIRPILCLLSCKLVSGDFVKALDVSVAIELIHTYSLIHDDIMDLDEERRGKPSLYKKYGIPLAILAGDGLLTLAFEILSDYPLISKEIAMAIGMDGMVFGQAEDILSMRNAECGMRNEEEINLNKTAKLFMASCVSGGMIGKGSKEQIEALREFGLNFGLLFQLKDDRVDNGISLKDYEERMPGLLDKAKISLSIFKKDNPLVKLLSYFKKDLSC
ncbi:MAG: polyprenyl synthetase family protein [bacterium]